MNADIGKNENDFTYTSCQIEIANILQIFLSRTISHALTLNSKKREGKL